MTTIGLIAAMRSESDALLKLVKGINKIGSGKWRFHVNGNDCWLVQSGMGGPAAAAAAQWLLEHAEVQTLFSFGIAGAVRADLNIGDVILGRQVCLLENGYATRFLPLATLPKESLGAVDRALSPHGSRLLPGTVVTTSGAQALNLQGRQVENPILEMETHAIALTAKEKGIPLFSVRAISDNPSAPIPLDLGAVVDEKNHFRLGKIIAEVLRHPSILKPGMNMLRNSGIACRNAAAVMLAILEQAFLSSN
jgi:adenosylhomocysteine nucleosidase